MNVIKLRSFPRVSLVLVVLVLLLFGVVQVERVWADYEWGQTSVGPNTYNWAGYIISNRFQASTSGILTSISLYCASTGGSARVAIYGDTGSAPSSLLAESTSHSISATGWESFSFSLSLTSGYYWLAAQWSGSVSAAYASSGGTMYYVSQAYGAFPSTFPSGNSAGFVMSIKGFITTGPPPIDFTITPTPPSQSVGAGVAALYTLKLDSLGGFTGTVSLSVLSGSPPGVTPTISPNPVSLSPSTSAAPTLSVPTLFTTGNGPFNIVVNASCTSPAKSHTVTVTLTTVIPPTSYSFNVKATATQVVVTLTYSWSGSGSPPSGGIAIAGPGGTLFYSESSAVVYDRTSISVSGSTNIYSIIHRATFTITAPISTQIWTALISLSGVSNYNVAIEVS